MSKESVGKLMTNEEATVAVATSQEHGLGVIVQVLAKGGQEYITDQGHTEIVPDGKFWVKIISYAGNLAAFWERVREWKNPKIN